MKVKVKNSSHMKYVRSARQHSCAPLLRSLLKKFDYTDTEELHGYIANGFMHIGKPKEGVGWPSKPDVAAPLPYHDFLCFYWQFCSRRTCKRSVGRANMEERLRAKD